MATGWPSDNSVPGIAPVTGRDRRREPRVDVLMRIKGDLVRPDRPILVHDLSRSGFAVLSQMPFASGQQLDFRLTSEDGTTFTVTAQAMHSRPMPSTPCAYLSGFMFIPGRLTGLVPQALIDRLISTVADPDVPCFFERKC